MDAWRGAFPLLMQLLRERGIEGVDPPEAARILRAVGSAVAITTGVIRAQGVPVESLLVLCAKMLATVCETPDDVRSSLRWIERLTLESGMLSFVNRVTYQIVSLHAERAAKERDPS